MLGAEREAPRRESTGAVLDVQSDALVDEIRRRARVGYLGYLKRRSERPDKSCEQHAVIELDVAKHWELASAHTEKRDTPIISIE